MASTIEKIFPQAAKKPNAGTVAWLNSHVARGALEPHAEVVTLTPALAAILLRQNPDNRPIRPIKVRHYASDMRSGRWPLNGETIILSKEGLLNDGQHRLEAVINANITIQATIFFGADRATRLTVDQGAARGAGAYLAMEGLPNANTRASIARLVLAYEAKDGKSVSEGQFLAPSEIFERAVRDQGIGHAAAYAEGNSKHTKPFAAPALIGFSSYVLRHQDEGDAEEYLTQLVFGENLRRKDPAYTVRERLLTLGKTARSDKIEVIFRGWNAFRQGRSLTIAKLMGGDLPALI